VEEAGSESRFTEDKRSLLCSGLKNKNRGVGVMMGVLVGEGRVNGGDKGETIWLMASLMYIK
jgi:hypothetical protein